MPQAAEANPKEHQGKNDKELSTILMPQAKHPNLEKDEQDGYQCFVFTKESEHQ